MIRFEFVVFLASCVFVVCLIIRKLRKIKAEYHPYFSQLNLVLKKQRSGVAAGILDLDRLDANLHFVQSKLGDSYKLRLVTKSLPSLDLLKYMMAKARTNRLMVFSESFIAEILSNLNADSLDILLGAPLPIDAFARLVTYNGWHNIHWLIDSKKRLNQYLCYAKREGVRIKVNLEIDVGLHRGGFDITDDFIAALEIIKQNGDFMELTGLMGYDGHVPYVPFYIDKEQSIRKSFINVQKVYKQFVDIVKEHYDIKTMSTMTFNSGGSHTYFYYSDYKSITLVNDIGIGSGFLAPQHFPNLIKLGHQPALFLSAPILKKINASKLPHAEKLAGLLHFWDPNLSVSYFMLGGGCPGELIDPIGLKKNYWWNRNYLGCVNLLPNQSVLGSSDENNLNIGDFVFYHPWEGDGMLFFKKLVLYRQNIIVGEWETYNGGN